MKFVPYDQTAKIVQPSKQAFNLAFCSVRRRWNHIYGMFDMADIVPTYFSRELRCAKSTKIHLKWPVVHCLRVRLALWPF